MKCTFQPQNSSASVHNVHFMVCAPLNFVGQFKITPLKINFERSKKFDLDRNFQSRSKFLISLENFNLDVSISPQKIGPRWVARSKISFSIEIFNLDRNLEFF